jgi:hypothetical protein
MKANSFAVLALLCVSAGLSSCSKPDDPRAQAFAKLPDWKGIWVSDGHTTDISGLGGANGGAPFKLVDPAGPWNDAGRAKMIAMMQNAGKRKAEGWGFPMMMESYAPLQFVIAPDATVIINSYHEVRVVFTDGRAHPKEEDRWPTTWGDSVGHWDGDTLVIDTVSVRDPTKYMFFAPTLSDQAHYVERLHLTATDRIESEITIDDPVNLTAPLAVKVAYVRTANLDRLVYDAFDNDRSELENGVFTIVPPKP